MIIPSTPWVMVMPFGDPSCEPVNDARPERRENLGKKYIYIFEFVTCTLKSNSICTVEQGGKRISLLTHTGNNGGRVYSSP